MLGTGGGKLMRRLADPLPVGIAVEQVPLQRHADEPVRTGLRDESPTVGFKQTANAHLRQVRSTRGLETRLGEFGPEPRLADLGPLGHGGGLPILNRHRRYRRGSQGRREIESRVQRHTQRLVQRRPDCVHHPPPLDFLLAHRRQVDLHREHIGVGRHPGIAHVARPRQIRLGGLHRRFRHFQRLAREHDRVVVARHLRDEMHCCLTFLLGRKLMPKPRLRRGGAYLAGVEDRLIDNKLRLEVVEKIGTDQRMDGEVCLSEAPLRQ